jgi:phosphoglycolate phosphatase
MPLQALQAIIFDFDGTLADSYAGITASVNHVRAVYNLAPLDESVVRRFVGRGPAALIRDTVPGADVRTAVDLYKAHHPSVMLTGTRLLPGVASTLDTLHESGLCLAVCSNKPRLFTQQLLDYLKLAEFIKVVIGPEDAPQPKPAPDMLLLAIDRLHVSPLSVLYVGDMVIDIETARAAGVAVWAVATGSQEEADLRAAGPDRLVRDFRELARLAMPKE